MELLLATFPKLNSDTGEYEPTVVSEKTISRYAEWRFSVLPNVVGTLTEQELVECPIKGIKKPQGSYSFTFADGIIYVEVEDEQVCSMAGYATDELNLFNIITKEHGEEIQRAFDAQGPNTEQDARLYQRNSTVQEDNESNTGMAI